MCYHAIYVPPGAPPFPREQLQLPEIRRYVEGWGRPGDLGYTALSDGLPVGAAWLRLMTGAEAGYGYVGDSIPELSIALLPESRGQGIGTGLMQRLLAAARPLYPAISLSVTASNPARHLYERMGFVTVAEKEGSLVMLLKHES